MPAPVKSVDKRKEKNKKYANSTKQPISIENLLRIAQENGGEDGANYSYDSSGKWVDQDLPISMF